MIHVLSAVFESFKQSRKVGVGVGGTGSSLRSAAFTEVDCGFLTVLYSHSRCSLLCNVYVHFVGPVAQSV